MSTCVELLRVFERVQARLDKGAASFNAIFTILARRADVETKFAHHLKEIIPDNYDKTDVVLAAFVEELTSEMNTHLILAQDMRVKVIVPAQTQGVTYRDKQKAVVSLAKKEVATIQKVLKEVENAGHELESQKAKLATTPPTKTEAQNQRIQKAAAELHRRKQQEVQVATNCQSRAIPVVHTDFSEIDSQRISKIQAAAVLMENLKKDANEALNQAIQLFHNKMTDYDGRKRSSKFVSKVFDTTATAFNENDQESGAVALSDFRSLDPHDLTFERGDHIEILVQHESGWWEGICNEKRGFFPSTFVTHPGEFDPTNDQIGAVFMAIRDFATTRGSEIPLLCGDLVYVDFVAKGRCSGTNLRTAARGFFPLDALEQRIKTDD
jgi:hypothetical protein